MGGLVSRAGRPKGADPSRSRTNSSGSGSSQLAHHKSFRSDTSSLDISEAVVEVAHTPVKSRPPELSRFSLVDSGSDRYLISSTRESPMSQGSPARPSPRSDAATDSKHHRPPPINGGIPPAHPHYHQQQPTAPSFVAAPVEEEEEAGAYEEETEEVPLEALSSLDLDKAEIRQIGKIQRWQRGTLVGSGSYGKVYLGMNKDTAELFVVKQVAFVGKEKCEEVIQLEQEIALLAQLEHDNIVKYLGTEHNMLTNELSIFLEYMPGGSIADLVKKFGELDESVMRKYTREVLEGLGYLHRKGIIHRDIKGQNILVDSRGVCKLADFGASRYLQSADSEANFSFKGTPVFMSPEVITEQRYSKKSDVWSVGCTVIQMATGNPPFSEFSNHIAVLFHITSSPDPPPVPDKLSAVAQDFCLLCFKRDPSQRPFVEQLIQHEFVKSARRPDQSPLMVGKGGNPSDLMSPKASTEDDEECYRKLRMERLQKKVPIRLRRERSRRDDLGSVLSSESLASNDTVGSSIHKP